MRRIGFGLLGLLIVMVLPLMLYSTADAQPVFVTNTPRPSPVPVSTADAPADQYALRMWTESALVETLIGQVIQLAGGEAEQEAAIRLTLYELNRRFPDAPRNIEDRNRLLEAMLTAPAGTVDLRLVARPYVVERLDDTLLDTGDTTVDNFRIIASSINLNGDNITDALLHIIYPANIEVNPLYNDFIPVVGTEAGIFELPRGVDTIPAAPYVDIEAVMLTRGGDLNQDTRDEFALTITTDALNDELRIFGLRSGAVVDLVLPGQPLRYGEINTWPEDGRTLAVAEYRLASDRWQCVSALDITWQWERNFYRPVGELNTGYEPLPSVGCQVAAEEPLYVQSAANAIETVENAIDDTSLFRRGADRAGMALAMLYLLAGEEGRAGDQAAGLLEQLDNNDWLRTQLNAFTVAAGEPDANPIIVCAALEEAARLVFDDETVAACDVDQVLQQFFVENPVPLDANLVDVLETLGLSVQQTVTVTQVGFLPRQVVDFALPGASWWSFAPTGDEVFVPTPTDPPVEFAEAAPAAEPVAVPQAALDALLVDDRPADALTALANVSAPLSIEAQYVQALAYDLTGNRTAARRAYYDLWVNTTGTVWGQLAGAHLERR
jgi:hypothetical protein